MHCALSALHGGILFSRGSQAACRVVGLPPLEVYAAPRLPHVMASQWTPIVHSAESMKLSDSTWRVDPTDLRQDSGLMQTSI